MSRLLGAAIAAGLCLGVMSGQARAASSGSACGAEPSAPRLDVSSVAAYNATVDKVTAYQKAARTYDTCATSAAAKEEAAISDDAKVRIGRVHDAAVASHGRIAANFTQQSAALQAASKKFGGH
ncbi:hypothetical protein AA103196_2771 [Ameyamaea chiangmaiensis NBRC 103196]|uniref:UrcA family protein n=1 Tax=Ameyamaea chiangmaiensis TaxID=442969 RepID=A0A850PAP5_9PROT|nr:hypothetical protein [Ameyamaea chiangmaiensis]MBS4074262.1 hypothetical protein [Ameyamaea chiangmaiensis]NVN41625.1 hypothetical protein [Ameyamaea chiangmaiensis]GBQ71421.1 hypothetical protein AA103196_2771 [Ameyamaea chiangmaiensis NBRC 103196]